MLLKNLHRHFCGGELYSLWLLITSLKIISRSSRLQTGGVDVEQGGKIVGGLLSQLLKRHPLQYRHILGNVTDQRRLVLFAAVGDRRGTANRFQPAGDPAARSAPHHAAARRYEK